MPDTHICKIAGSKRLAGAVYAITAECGGMAETARAGQFVHIKCGAERLLRRPISICRAGAGTLEFVFEAKGAGTRWLSGQAQGQTLDILGPLGKGFEIPVGDIITVGGGIGAPPMLFAAESAKGAVTAVIGFRSADNIILKEDFEAACEKVLITTDDGSYGIRGTVAVPLEELLKSGNYATVLACGPRPMLSSVAALCLNYATPCQVSLEERMGCGVGACVVCACATVEGGVSRMRRVCRDGPVFDAMQVVW